VTGPTFSDWECPAFAHSLLFASGVPAHCCLFSRHLFARDFLRSRFMNETILRHTQRVTRDRDIWEKLQRDAFPRWVARADVTSGVPTRQSCAISRKSFLLSFETGWFLRKICLPLTWILSNIDFNFSEMRHCFCFRLRATYFTAFSSVCQTGCCRRKRCCLVRSSRAFRRN